MPMSDADANRLRAKQDRLLELATPRYHLDLRISADEPGSPTLRDLQRFVWPEWEATIDRAIARLERGE